MRRVLDEARELSSIVRMMKLTAASGVVQVERGLASLDEYEQTVRLGLFVTLGRGRARPALPRTPREHVQGRVSVVIFGSDQGLVGSFNDVIAQYGLAQLRAMEGPKVWVVGERLHDLLRDAAVPIAGGFSMPASVGAIAGFVDLVLIELLAHCDLASADQLWLLRNQVSAGKQAPVARRVLPFDEAWNERITGSSWPTRVSPEVIGAAAVTLRALLREYLAVSMFRACAESLASEHDSRLVAMQRAERNIEELVRVQQGALHIARQGRIDGELFEVVAGFEALGLDAVEPHHAARADLRRPR